MTTLQNLELDLEAKRAAYKTADKETRELLLKDAEIIKLRIRVLETAERSRGYIEKIATKNVCTHPIKERHFYDDGSEACDNCNVLFVKESK